jgi:hypothetical protein
MIAATLLSVALFILLLLLAILQVLDALSEAARLCLKSDDAV